LDSLIRNGERKVKKTKNNEEIIIQFV